MSYKYDNFEGEFKMLPNGLLGRCYLLRSNLGACIELTCSPDFAIQILASLNVLTDQDWQLFDKFNVEFDRKEVV